MGGGNGWSNGIPTFLCILTGGWKAVIGKDEEGCLINGVEEEEEEEGVKKERGLIRLVKWLLTWIVSTFSWGGICGVDSGICNGWPLTTGDGSREGKGIVGLW